MVNRDPIQFIWMVNTVVRLEIRQTSEQGPIQFIWMVNMVDRLTGTKNEGVRVLGPCAPLASRPTFFTHEINSWGLEAYVAFT